jgi:bifunctional pyridoxal-dependent enzyme with beta-cystathionase and maltose regulon repressor activities
LPREDLARAFGQRTKAVVVNNPQNPCGKAFTRDELVFIGSLCARHEAFALPDHDAYGSIHGGSGGLAYCSALTEEVQETVFWAHAKPPMLLHGHPDEGE